MAERRDVLKSKMSIKKAFLDLRKEKDIRKITVTEIIDCANISKGTFYSHYTDIYDLQEQIENEIIADIFSGIENENITAIIDEPFKWVLKIVAAFYNQRESISCLMGKSNNYNFFFKCESELLRLLRYSDNYFDNEAKRIIIDNCIASMIVRNCYNVVKDEHGGIDLNGTASIISEFIYKMLH